MKQTCNLSSRTWQLRIIIELAIYSQVVRRIVFAPTSVIACNREVRCNLVQLQAVFFLSPIRVLSTYSSIPLPSVARGFRPSISPVWHMRVSSRTEGRAALLRHRCITAASPPQEWKRLLSKSRRLREQNECTGANYLMKRTTA